MMIVVGALGMIAITTGILVRHRWERDLRYIFGGLLLIAYSVAIADPVFVVLQVIFTMVAAYDFFRGWKRQA